MGMVKKVTLFSLLTAAVLGVKKKMMKKGKIRFMCRKKMSLSEKLSEMIHKIFRGIKKNPRQVFFWGR